MKKDKEEENIFLEQICAACGGTNEQEYWTFNKQKEETGHGFTGCLSNGETREEAWKEIAIFLNMEIHCKVDDPFDPENPFKKRQCAGCEYEIRHILDLVWHYGQLSK